MINGKTILAIITARGNSKGLPGKNIKELNGKALIAWTIEAAKESKHVDRVIVSSDSNDILAVSREFGADTPFVRPDELAGDLSKQEDAILHAMDWMEENAQSYDYVMVLFPTTPLRDASEIDKVMDFLGNHDKARAVYTVTRCAHTPFQANVLPENLSMKNFISDELKWKNRQEFPIYYQLCGSICVSEWEYFKEQKSFLTPETYAFVTSARKGVDIDNLIDFLLAEIYMKHPTL